MRGRLAVITSREGRYGSLELLGMTGEQRADPAGVDGRWDALMGTMTRSSAPAACSV